MARPVAKDTIAEGPAGTVKSTPGRRSDDAIGDETTLLLKGANGSVDGVVKRGIPLFPSSLSRFAGQEAKKREVISDLGDGWPVIPEAVRR
jgi:hypothetical protein